MLYQGIGNDDNDDGDGSNFDANNGDNHYGIDSNPRRANVILPAGWGKTQMALQFVARVSSTYTSVPSFAKST